MAVDSPTLHINIGYLPLVSAINLSTTNTQDTSSICIPRPFRTILSSRNTISLTDDQLLQLDSFWNILKDKGYSHQWCQCGLVCHRYLFYAGTTESEIANNLLEALTSKVSSCFECTKSYVHYLEQFLQLLQECDEFELDSIELLKQLLLDSDIKRLQSYSRKQYRIGMFECMLRSDLWNDPRFIPIVQTFRDGISTDSPGHLMYPKPLCIDTELNVQRESSPLIGVYFLSMHHDNELRKWAHGILAKYHSAKSIRESDIENTIIPVLEFYTSQQQNSVNLMHRNFWIGYNFILNRLFSNADIVLFLKQVPEIFLQAIEILQEDFQEPPTETTVQLRRNSFISIRFVFSNAHSYVWSLLKKNPWLILDDFGQLLLASDTPIDIKKTVLQIIPQFVFSLSTSEHCDPSEYLDIVSKSFRVLLKDIFTDSASSEKSPLFRVFVWNTVLEILEFHVSQSNFLVLNNCQSVWTTPLFAYLVEPLSNSHDKNKQLAERVILQIFAHDVLTIDTFVSIATKVPSTLQSSTPSTFELEPNASWDTLMAIRCWKYIAKNADLRLLPMKLHCMMFETQGITGIHKDAVFAELGESMQGFRKIYETFQKCFSAYLERLSRLSSKECLRIVRDTRVCSCLLACIINSQTNMQLTLGVLGRAFGKETYGDCFDSLFTDSHSLVGFAQGIERCVNQRNTFGFPEDCLPAVSRIIYWLTFFYKWNSFLILQNHTSLWTVSQSWRLVCRLIKAVARLKSHKNYIPCIRKSMGMALVILPFLRNQCSFSDLYDGSFFKCILMLSFEDIASFKEDFYKVCEFSLADLKRQRGTRYYDQIIEKLFKRKETWKSLPRGFPNGLVPQELVDQTTKYFPTCSSSSRNPSESKSSSADLSRNPKEGNNTLLELIPKSKLPSIAVSQEIKISKRLSITESIILWEPKQISKKVAEDVKKFLQEIPDSFQDLKQYQNIFHPFILEEARSVLDSALSRIGACAEKETDDRLECYKAKCLPCSSDNEKDESDGFTLLNLRDVGRHSLFGDSFSESTLSANDCCFMVAVPPDANSATIREIVSICITNRQGIFGVLTPSSRNKREILMKCSSLRLSKRSMDSCIIIPLESLVTLQREENTLLSTLSHSSLLSSILCQRVPSSDLSESEPYESNQNLNESQNKAFNQCIKECKDSTSGFTLIQGPPGCGKSYLSVQIISRLLSIPLESKSKGWKSKSNLGKRTHILVCAPSNAAIDDLTVKLSQSLPSYHSIVRVGGGVSTTSPAYQYSLRHIVDCALKNENTFSIDELRKLQSKAEKISQRLESTKMSETERNSLLKEKRAVKKQIQESSRGGNSGSSRRPSNTANLKLDILNSATVICCTLSSSGSEIMRQLSFGFETVLIDECAQSVELSALIPLSLGATRCILVGDPKQLPATVISPLTPLLGYDRSIFERLQKCGHPIQMLTHQYRMHPEIRVFPSNQFYQGKLVDALPLESFQTSLYDQLIQPYLFLDVSGKEQLVGTSLFNSTEARTIIDLFVRIASSPSFAKEKPSIGIITPYVQQVKEILSQGRSLPSALASAFRKVAVSTVDSFQGQEKDFILYSSVRGKRDKGKGNGIGFVGDVRRLNVALTRAKKSLVVVGCSRVLSSSADWRSLIQDAKDRNKFHSMDELRKRKHSE